MWPERSSEENLSVQKLCYICSYFDKYCSLVQQELRLEVLFTVELQQRI